MTRHYLRNKDAPKEPAKPASNMYTKSLGYSEEALAELRQNQKYQVPSKPVEPVLAPAEVQEVAMENSGSTLPNVGEADSGDPFSARQILAAKEKRRRQQQIAAGEYVPIRGRGLDSSDPFARSAGFEAGSSIRKDDVGFNESASSTVVEVDDEMARWEMEQIRRGGRGAETQALQKMQANLKERQSHRGWQPGLSRTAQATPITVRVSSLDEVLLELNKALEEAQEACEQNERYFTKLSVDEEAGEEAIAKLKAEIEQVSSDFEYYQQIRDHAQDMCSCIRAKQTMISQLEDAFCKLRGGRSSRRRRRRGLHLEDELRQLHMEGGLLVRSGKELEPPEQVEESSEGVRHLRQQQRSRRRQKQRQAGGGSISERHLLAAGVWGEEEYGSEEEEEGEVMEGRVKELQEAQVLVFADARPELWDITQVRVQASSARSNTEHVFLTC